MISLLFVCQANVCRSVALQGFLQALIDIHHQTDNYYLDSCGIGPLYPGQSVDLNTQKAAQKRGVILSHQAREFTVEDFLVFDYVFAVSRDIKKFLESLTSDKTLKEKVHLATDFSSLYQGQDMIDPYCGGQEGFDTMLDLVGEIAQGIFNDLSRRS